MYTGIEGMMILHIVLLKLKPGVSQTEIGGLDRALAALPSQIPGIVDYKWGRNVSPEQRNHGFEHGFVLTFESAAARDAYLPHPEHQQVAALIGSLCDDVLVFDMEIR